MAHADESSDKPASLGYSPMAALTVAIGTYVASDVIAGLFLSLIPLFTGWNAAELRSWLEGSVIAQFLTILIAVVVVLGLLGTFLRSRKVPLARIGLVRPRFRDAKYAVLGYIVYFVAFMIISQVAAQLISGLSLEQEQEVLFDKGTSGGALWLVFLSLVVLPAFVEETLLRGFLYSGLRSKWPKLIAALVTSGLFAIAHLQFGSGNALLWIAALDTFILSIILVYIREKTGSLAGPIMVHFIKNSLAFTFLFLIRV